LSPIRKASRRSFPVQATAWPMFRTRTSLRARVSWWEDPIRCSRRCSSTWRKLRREASTGRAAARQSDAETKAPSRYIPAATRRAVFERDQGRCAYVDERGERCRETSRLQIHHLEAFAKGGRHELSKLSLRCEAHNTLAAEDDFGREYIDRKRDGGRHESLRVASRTHRHG
jgi:5-methylcytosine-specific restriction endonuclease McrA